MEISIKFTFELESNNKLAFLDTSVIHNPGGRITTKVFRKSINNNNLPFSSHYPIQNKIAVVKTLSGRANNICTNEKEKKDELSYI